MAAVALALVSERADAVLLVLAAALAGGALGAALGAVPSLVLSGLALLVGEVTTLVSDGPSPVGEVLVEWVALGPLLGPHVAFAGGAAAAAYGSRKGTLDPEGEYYPGKNVTTPPGLQGTLLAVGAAFGLLGVVVRRAAGAVGAPLDTIALAVVVSAFVHRLAFGYALLGVVRTPTGERFDMASFDHDERHAAAPDGGRLRGEVDRLRVEPWQPSLYAWPRAAVVGLVVGLVAGLVTALTGSVLLPFALALALLGLELLDPERLAAVEDAPEWLPDAVDRFPAVYHTALLGALGATAVAGLGPALLAGAGFGLVGGLLGEAAQRTLYAHGSTHLDPGFVAVLVASLPLGLAALVFDFAVPLL